MIIEPERAGPILVGIADVEASDPALRYAADEAVRNRTSVRVVHVLTEESAPDADTMLGHAAARVRELTHGRATVEAVAHAGPLVPALVTSSRDAALVVLQRRPRTRLQWLLEGSVSAHVAGQAHVPTVWVPEAWHSCDAIGRHLVVGVDAADDVESADLLQHAFARAVEHGATLTVVHGWQLSSGYDDAIIDQQVVTDWADRYRRALQRHLSVLAAEHPEVYVEVEIAHSPPAEALVQAAKGASLLMLARGRLAHPLVGRLGSVTRAVMQSSDCPVEIIPDARP